MLDRLIEIKRQIKELEIEQKTLEEEVINEIESGNIPTEIKNDFYSLKYVPTSSKEHFDSKTFREQNQDLYDTYIKIIPVKSSLRITLK